MALAPGDDLVVGADITGGGVRHGRRYIRAENTMSFCCILSLRACSTSRSFREDMNAPGTAGHDVCK